LRSEEELAGEDLADETLAAIEESERLYGRGEVRDLGDLAAELRAKLPRR